MILHIVESSWNINNKGNYWLDTRYKIHADVEILKKGMMYKGVTFLLYKIISTIY